MPRGCRSAEIERDGTRVISKPRIYPAGQCRNEKMEQEGTAITENESNGFIGLLCRYNLRFLRELLFKSPCAAR